MADLLQFPALASVSTPFAEARDRVPEDGASSLGFGDAEAREAALDIRRSWIVEAPAGSGKTGLLIQRYLKLLAYGDVARPGEVLAITFTRKAAAELRNRVLEQLEHAADGKPLPAGCGVYERTTREIARQVLHRDQALNWQLLRSPQSLNIRTIDAFCGELAGSLPLTSGGAGRLQPMDDASLLYEEAAERTLRELGNRTPDPQLDDALQTVLYHRDAQIRDVVRLIAEMLRGREQWGELVPVQGGALSDPMLDGQVRIRLEQTLERVICAGLNRAYAAIGESVLDALAPLAARLSHAPPYRELNSPLAACSGRSDGPGTTADNLEHWLALVHLVLTADGRWRKSLAKNYLGFELPKQEKPPLEDLLLRLRAEDDLRTGLREALCAVRTLPPARYPDDQWHVVKALLRVLRHALIELNALFAERGQCDFTEIALTARSVLRSAPDLLELPGAQLKHLLVDEMQDTSTGQYELLEMLTRNWDGFTQTVFLVGDPKQSIYMFRQARVARFLRTQESGLLGELPLGALRLTANFRSQSHLVEDFNDVFRLVLPASKAASTVFTEEAEVPFVAAEARRVPGVTSALQWHPRIASSEAERSGTEAEDDAQSIRNLIEDFQARWANRADGDRGKLPRIAVLARSKAHLAPIVAEFQQARSSGPLAFRAVEIELLRERREVLDLLALTRALLHPGDRVAWLAVLRSPVCGLTLADLLALCGEGPEADMGATVAQLVETRHPLLSQDGQVLLDRTWPILQAARENAGGTGLSTLVERTWRTLGGDAFLKPEEHTNAQRYLKLLRDLESRSEALSLSLLKRALDKLYADSHSAPGAVELLTIHKAKGLEWDLVIVPALERDTAANAHELLKWLELDGEHGSEAEVIVSPISGKGEDSSRLSSWITGRETGREMAEAKRLLYVACTRAREELHLFASCTRKNDGSLALPPAKSLLRAGWPAAEPVFSRLLPAGGAKTETPVLSFPGTASGASRMPETLNLAAAGEADSAETTAVEAPPTLWRLPLEFRPLDRFPPRESARLSYPSASELRHSAPYQRPEGSFRARAFGNTMHRFMEVLADRLSTGESAESMLHLLPTWETRVRAALRAEGLPPSLCAREGERALQALSRTLQHSEGEWIVSPRRRAHSERALQTHSSEGSPLAGGIVRADRTFYAGSQPLSEGADTHLWIVDYKTAEAGGRAESEFLAAEKAKYEPQLQAYATALARSGEADHPIVLALYYPLLTRLLYWPYRPETASD